MRAQDLLAEIGRLYRQLRARPDFGYSERSSAESRGLEDQIRRLADRYTRQTASTTDDHRQARVADSQYQAASP